MIRCKWCNLKNEKYIEYHDKEWGVPIYDDKHLYEMLILESFQAGLSWECVLNKRESFRKAFDNFEIDNVCAYDDKKVQELLENENIIRNKLKINAAINNSRIFKKIKSEYDTSGKTQYDTVKKNLSQKYKLADIEEDAGGNYLGGIPKTIKKGVNKIKKKIIKKSKNTGSGGNH